MAGHLKAVDTSAILAHIEMPSPETVCAAQRVVAGHLSGDDLETVLAALGIDERV
jgi:hypothetical protein